MFKMMGESSKRKAVKDLSWVFVFQDNNINLPISIYPLELDLRGGTFNAVSSR